MPLPICIEIPEIPDPLQITLPGGVTMEHINLMEVIQPALTPLVPLFNIIDTVVAVFNCIKAIPDTLRQARSQLLHLQQQMVQILGAIDRATELEDAGLMAITSCAQANVAQEAANVGKSLAALGKLIGLLNLFLGMVGGPEVPDLSDLAGRPLDEAIAPIDAIVETLQAVRSAVPVP